MKKCKYCGAELPDNAKACSNCGRPLSDDEGTETADQNHTAGNTSASDAAKHADEEQKNDDKVFGKSPNGYWQYGKWHPFEDLNKHSSDTNTWNPSGTQGQENQYGQNNGTQYGQNAQNGQYGQNNQYGWNGQYGPGNGNPNGGWQNGNYGNGNFNNGNGPWNNGGFGPGPWNEFGGMESGQKYNGFAAASMALGLMSFVLDGFLLFVPSILAIVFGIIGLVQIKKNPQLYKGKWTAIVGIATGAIFLVLYIAIFIYAASLMRDPAFMKQLQEYINQLSGTTGGGASA